MSAAERLTFCDPFFLAIAAEAKSAIPVLGGERDDRDDSERELLAEAVPLERER